MEYQEILVTLSKSFNKYKLNYFVSGSLAVSFYGRQRASHDFDFLFEVSKKDQENFLSSLKELPADFSYDTESVVSSLSSGVQTNILYIPEGLKIDFWFTSKTPFDRSRFKNKKKVEIFNQIIYFSSPEDTILIKLDWYKKSQSDRHLEDAASVFQIQKNLDHKYLSLWAKKLNVENYLKQLKSFPVQEW